MGYLTRRLALGLVLVLLLALAGTSAALELGPNDSPTGNRPPDKGDVAGAHPLSGEWGKGRGATLPVEPQEPVTDDPPVGAEPVAPSDAPGVEPKAVSAGPLAPGESAAFEKRIQTPSIPPKPDIYFLADSTGSMGPAISNVQANASTILTQVSTTQPDAQFGAGNYRDFPFEAGGYAFQNDAPIGGRYAALTAIAAWSPLVGGGGDGSEAQLYALDQIAAGGTGWRTDSTRIVVWFGDWPGHDPVCAAISGLTHAITEGSATAKLVAEGIRVIAISVSTNYSVYDPGCTLCDLDGDPELNASDYSGICVINGSAGQATRIAAATGGVLFSSVAPDQVSAAILEGLQNLPATVAPQLDPACSGELEYVFSPISQTLTSGQAASFTETITVKPDATAGLKTCTVHWLINEVPAGPDFEQSISIEVQTNQRPSADAGGPYAGDEGAPIPLDGSASSDPDGDPLSHAWGVDDPKLCSFDDPSSATPKLTCTDNGDFTVTLEVSDGQATDSATAAVTVHNVPPSVRIDSVAPAVLAVCEPVGDGKAADSATTAADVYNVPPGARIGRIAPAVLPACKPCKPVTARGSFADPGSNDTHTAQWDWGDGGTSPGTLSGLDVGPDDHAYTTPGMYTIKLTVTDDDGGVGMDTFQYVVVYDPGAGFVTGGGWIDSPAGAYGPDKDPSGKANFGFVAKYRQGRSKPQGNTEFHFRAAGLNFHSAGYEWLVITGKNYAQFMGSGTVNGEGGYHFMVWAGDGTGTGGADTFRIRIWKEDTSGDETTLYDNGTDQTIGGGSIVVHTQGQK